MIPEDCQVKIEGEHSERNERKRVGLDSVVRQIDNQGAAGDEYGCKSDKIITSSNALKLGFRFFEGSASGAVMIGEYPKTKAFEENFGWPDSVIHVPFDTPDIAEILAELNSQTQRIAEIRKQNVIQSLLRHDWAYRWKEILKIAGLQPMAALTNRLEHLKKLVEDIEKNPV